MTLRPRDRVALVAIAAIVLVAGFYKLVLSPKRQQVSALQSQIDTQRSALTAAQSQYSAGRQAQIALTKSSVDLAAIHRAVPNASDIPALLRVLQRNALDVGVDLSAVVMTDSSGSSSTDTTGATDTASTSDGATAVPVSLTFKGGYQRLDRLVRRLDGLVVLSHDHIRSTGPLLSISNVSITKTPVLTVALTASLYQRSATSAATDTATSTAAGGS